MQPLDPTIKSTWLTPTQTAIAKANAKLLQDNLADDATLADQLKTWQQEINSNSEPTVQEPLKKAFALWMKDARIPTSIQTILAKDPTAKVPSYITNYLALDPKDPTSVAAYKSQLTKEFGGLKNSKGESLINTDLIDAVASGSADFNDLGNQIITAVQAATNKSLGSSASQFSDITNSPTYKSLLNDPSKLTDSYNTSVAKLTKNADTGTWEVGGSGDALTGAASSPIGPNGEYIYTGGIGQLSTDGTIDPSKMTKMVDSYDTQKGVWSLPSINKDTNLFEAGTSPYGNLLANSLNNFASKGDYYSPTYVNSLASKQPAAMSSEGIAALKGEFTDPGTSKDLLNLANSAGMNYDTANAPGGITADSKLSPTLLKAYQLPTTPNTSSAGTQTTGQAKPGVPNLTGARSTAPVTALPTTTPGLLTGQTITTKDQADAAKAIAEEKLRLEQEELAKENAEKIKLNSAWYKAGYSSADDYSKGMALGYSSGADYYDYLKNNSLSTSTEKDLTWWNEYNKGISPKQIKANNAAFSTWTDGQKASVKTAYEASKSMPAWQRAGFNSQEEANAAGKLGVGAEDYYKSQRATGTRSSTVAGGAAWTPELEKLYADHDVAAAKYYKWTPDELAKYLAYGGNNTIFKAYGEGEYIPEGASLAALSAPKSNINTVANTPLYHKDTDSRLTFSDQAKAKDILAQLDALGPVKPLAETGKLNLDPNTEAGRANIAAGNSSTTWNASWEKSPNNHAFIGSPFYDPNRATILSDKKILNDQLEGLRTQTDQAGTVYNYLPDYGVWQPQNQTAPVINQGIAAGTSKFTTPENMNTNTGGIPTVLPANTQTVTPAAQQAYTETHKQVLANPTDTSWVNSYNKGVSPEQAKANSANIATYSPEQQAPVASLQSYLAAMPAWQRAGYVNEADSTTAKSLGVTPDDYYRTHPVQ